MVKLSVFRGAALSAGTIMSLAAATPASAQWAVIDVSNLVQTTKTAITEIDSLIELQQQGVQAVNNAKRAVSLDGMLDKVTRSVSQLSDEQVRAVANDVYRTDPTSASALSQIQATLRAQGAPAAKTDALARLTNAIGASQSSTTLGNYDGMYARADNAANLTRSIADVEKDRATLAQSVNDYATEGHNLGDNNLAATMQHVASGNLLNARQMNKMIEAQNITAQQNQDQINRELSQESAVLESHIRAIQKAQASQNIVVPDVNASTAN